MPQSEKAFSFKGASPPDALTKGSAPGPRWGLRPHPRYRHGVHALTMYVSGRNFYFVPTPMDVTRKTVYRMFFLCRNLESCLICTLKP